MDNITIILISLLLSAFFSGMEIAFISSNNLKIELDKSKGLLSGRIFSRFNQNPSKFIGALLLGNNVALVIYGIAMADLLTPYILALLPDYLERESLVLLIQTIIATVLILFTAEFLPKALFRQSPNVILNFFAVPVFLFYYLSFPVIWIFTGFAGFLLNVVFGIKSLEQAYVFSAIDLDDYIRNFSGEKLEVDDVTSEIQMVQNALDFSNVKLRACMVPRPEISALESNESLDELRKLFIETGFSKILIYKESIDNIIGYVHSSDLFKKPADIKSIMRSVFFVPETMLANNVLSMFFKQHKSIAIVVDEFGGTAGIVTMEDIMEEIFGEIEDEYDEDEFTDKQITDNEYILSGRLEIDYLNEKYGMGFPQSDDYETIAGFIINNHESIPELRDEISIGKYTFTILQASENRIKQVRLKIH
ncbi:MAG: hemolysin family protein [Bacteroidales bacterium]|jgi:CBS domain containing-hemolysin-like protein|nr:hemolysin family protein [Bacteroidales bacterium]